MTAKFGLLIDAKTKGENNIKRLGNSMQGVEGKAKNLGMAVRGVGSAFKALFAAAAVAGFSAFVKGAIDSADAFGKLSTRTGIAADKLQAYVNAGKLADVSQSEIENGLRKLTQTQVEASEGVKTYSEAYAKLGLSVKQADGSLKPSDQLLGEIADKFQDLPNGPEKAAIAMDIFGRSGSKLITLLNGGTEALERFNYETSVNFAQNAEYFNDQITTLQIKFDGFRKQLADALLPALNAILEVFSDLFDSDADFSALFDVIGVGIRGIAFAVLGVTKAIDELVRLITTAFKIVDAARKFDFGEVGKLGQEYGVGVAKRFQVSREQFNKILFGTSEVGVDYGGGGRDRGGRDRGGRDPSSVTEQLDKVTEETSGNTKVQVSAEVLRLTKEINTARLAGNRLAEVDLGYDLAIQQLKEKGLTGNNLELEQSNLLTQYTLDRLNAVHGLADAQDDLNEKTDKYKITLDQVKDTLANQMTSVIEGLIDGTKSLGESLSGVLRQISSLFLQAGIGSFKGADGTGGSGLLGLFANGGVIAKNKVVPFAYGGVVNKPTLFPMANGAGLMGEAGPEAIMPLRRGPGGRLGVESSGGVGNVVVNVDASGSNVQGDAQQGKALGQAIGAAVQAELIKQKRPGGLLS